jgi:hypothetical protein
MAPLHGFSGQVAQVVPVKLPGLLPEAAVAAKAVVVSKETPLNRSAPATFRPGSRATVASGPLFSPSAGP